MRENCDHVSSELSNTTARAKYEHPLSLFHTQTRTLATFPPSILLSPSLTHLFLLIAGSLNNHHLHPSQLVDRETHKQTTPDPCMHELTGFTLIHSHAALFQDNEQESVILNYLNDKQD